MDWSAAYYCSSQHMPNVDMFTIGAPIPIQSNAIAVMRANEAMKSEGIRNFRDISQNI